MGDGRGEACQGCLEQKHRPEKIVKTRNYLSTLRRPGHRVELVSTPGAGGQHAALQSPPELWPGFLTSQPDFWPLPFPGVHKREPHETSQSSCCGLSSLISLLSHLHFLEITALSLSFLCLCSCRSLCLEYQSLALLPASDPGSPAPTLPGGLRLVLGSHLPPSSQTNGLRLLSARGAPCALPAQPRTCHCCPP